MKKEFIEKEVNPFDITPQEEKEIEENRIKNLRRKRFCEWAEIIKKENNINDKQLAELFPITPQYLSNLKSGKKSVSNNIIERMIELTKFGSLRYSFDYLSGVSDITGEYEKQKINKSEIEKKINLLIALYDYNGITIDKQELNNLYYGDPNEVKQIHLYDSNSGIIHGHMYGIDDTRFTHALDIVTDIFRHYV